MVFCCLGVLVLLVSVFGCGWSAVGSVVVLACLAWWFFCWCLGGCCWSCGSFCVWSAVGFLVGVVVSVFFFWCLDRWGVCLFCCLLSCVLWLSSCLGFCCLLVFLLWCLLFGVLVLLVLVAGRVLSGVFSSGAVCGSSLIFLVCSFGWSAVAVLGFVLVVSTVFVCLVNESSAGADADLFVYK